MNTEAWAHWENQVVDGSFAVRRLLGSTASSAVFLTEHKSNRLPNAVIKLVRAEALQAQDRLAQWQAAAGLSHPHLVRLFEMGRCQLDGQEFLFLVMEHADQTLAQILRNRALSSEETRELMLPTLEALTFLHGNRKVHGQLKPANFLAVGDQLKLASDCIRPVGYTASGLVRASPYDAPEVGNGGCATAGDMWSLGVTLVETLTQRTPAWSELQSRLPLLAASLPAPFALTVRRCLNISPADRPTVAELAVQYDLVLKTPSTPARQSPAREVPPAAAVPPAVAATPVVAVPPPVAAAPVAAVRPPIKAPPPSTVSKDPPKSPAVAKELPQAPAVARDPPQSVAVTKELPQARAVARDPPQAPVVIRDSSRSVAVAGDPPRPIVAAEEQPGPVLKHQPEQGSKKWALPFTVIPGALLVALAIWGGIRLTGNLEAQLQPSVVPAPPSTVPSPTIEKPAAPEPHSSITDARPIAQPPVPPESDAQFVIQEVKPDVPQAIQDKIRGRIYVTVRVLVDPSGNVMAALMEDPGTSKYFARLSDKAAREWQFVASDQQQPRVWLLRFEYRRDDISIRAIAQ